jgi:hypothetical protein
MTGAATIPTALADVDELARGPATARCTGGDGADLGLARQTEPAPWISTHARGRDEVVDDDVARGPSGAGARRPLPSDDRVLGDERS